MSEKADIYSYGVVVLEIMSGQKSNEFKEGDPVGEYLLQRVIFIENLNFGSLIIQSHIFRITYNLTMCINVLKIRVKKLEISHAERYMIYRDNIKK